LLWRLGRWLPAAVEKGSADAVAEFRGK
jgi:hypothetical protein